VGIVWWLGLAILSRAKQNGVEMKPDFYSNSVFTLNLS
jgi:hypothetical protein